MGQPSSDPARSYQHTGESNNNARPKAIDQVSIDRKQSRLSDYEESESPLNCIQAGMQTMGQVRRKQRPGILEIRDGQHRDRASDKYAPSWSARIVALTLFTTDLTHSLHASLDA